MNTSEINELKLKRQLHKAEQCLDSSVISQLANARATAVAQENKWFNEYFERFGKYYRGLFSASAITAFLAVFILLPTGEQLLSDDESGLNPEDSVTLLMEDPEFYLWLDKKGMLFAER